MLRALEDNKASLTIQVPCFPSEIGSFFFFDDACSSAHFRRTAAKLYALSGRYNESMLEALNAFSYYSCVPHRAGMVSVVGLLIDCIAEAHANVAPGVSLFEIFEENTLRVFHQVYVVLGEQHFSPRTVLDLFRVQAQTSVAKQAVLITFHKHLDDSNTAIADLSRRLLRMPALPSPPPATPFPSEDDWNILNSPWPTSPGWSTKDQP
jgi:hypothetical protein